MTHVLEARRRLLLSIIRGPTLSHQISPTSRSLSQTRLYHNSDICRSNNTIPSITFGSRIDGLLDAGKRLRKSSPKKNKNRGDELGVEAIKIDGDEAAVETSTTPKTSKKRVKTEMTDVGSQQTRKTSQLKVTTTDRAGTIEADPVLLELSGDAYDTISEPGIRASRDRDGFSTRSKRQGRSIERSPAKGRAPQKSGTTSTKDNRSEQRSPNPPPKLEPWRIQKDALQKKFGEEGWNPRKRLSPDAIEGIRAMHEEDPERYTTEILSQQFKVSPEAIRRMLRSKWRPSPELMDERRQRWAKRHDTIWDHKAALGLRPSRTRDKEPEGPEAFEEEVYAKKMLGNL